MRTIVRVAASAMALAKILEVVIVKVENAVASVVRTLSVRASLYT